MYQKSEKSSLCRIIIISPVFGQILEKPRFRSITRLEFQFLIRNALYGLPGTNIFRPRMRNQYYDLDFLSLKCFFGGGKLKWKSFQRCSKQNRNFSNLTVDVTPRFRVTQQYKLTDHCNARLAKSRVSFLSLIFYRSITVFDLKILGTCLPVARVFTI